MKTLSLLLVALLIGGLSGLAVYEYQTNRPQPTATVSQKQYDKLLDTLRAHDSLNASKTDQLTTQIQSGDTKLASICAQLKALKAVNANCQ